MNPRALGRGVWVVAQAMVAVGPVLGMTPPRVALPPNPSTEDVRRSQVLGGPLVPIGGLPAASENQALAEALKAYVERHSTEAIEPLAGFLSAHPASPWAAALATRMGMMCRHTGHYSKAIDFWKKGWTLAKSDSTPEGRAVADQAYSELVLLDARLGRMDDLEALFKEGEGRAFVSSAGEKVRMAKEGYWRMQHEPEHSFRCGPMALGSLRKPLGLAAAPNLDQALSTQQGTSLLQNWQWAQAAHMDLQMAYRAPGSAIVVPSLVHWKAGHFAALVKREGDRFLLQDPTFGEELWVSQAALDDEASGYQLVRADKLAKGWRPVTEAEGRTVWGKGDVGGSNHQCATPPTTPDCHRGMPAYGYFNSQGSLAVSDNPVGYAPPRGYPVQFNLTYFQQSLSTYTNLGPLWSCDWVSFFVDDPTNPGQTLEFFNRYGGQQTYSGYNPTTKSYGVQPDTFDQLVLNADGSYTRWMPDGSQEIFGQSDGSSIYPRKMFITQRIDPAGNALTFVYESQTRLVAVRDALGQTTTLSYGLSSDPSKITQVTDPFGRSAKLTYTSNGMLASITDAMGMTSSFSYGPTAQSTALAADFINAMTTPYGVTSFDTGAMGAGYWLQVTDAYGAHERMEFQPSFSSAPETEPTAPSGVLNGYLSYRNVFFWDKRAMALAPGDYTQATVTHYNHDTDISVMSDVVESTKKPLESRVWYSYPGQPSPNVVGTINAPSRVARMLPDGTEQDNSYQRNALGKATQATDPAGRVTSYVYAANGIDLMEVRNTTAGRNELLSSYTYNPQHRPLTVTDAAGQATTFTYNGWGEVASVTNARNEKTTFTYDGSGYLTSVSGPLTGATTSFTYDAAGRIATVTGPDGYTLGYSYDALDRRTQITYPDGSTEQSFYDRMEVGTSKDRLGRMTSFEYDPLRHMVAVEDAQGRRTSFDWCACGQLEGMVDAMGRATNWVRDIQGRVITKIYPDNTTVQYAYDTTGRLTSRLDAKGQTSSYVYGIDDLLGQVTYFNTQVLTPSVSYTYDAAYPRLTSMTDGTGMSTYTYYPITSPIQLGAGRLQTVQSPMPNSAITYSYDELGRVVNRSINGVAESRGFDVLGRLSQVTNPLGTFQYTYDGATSRVLKVALPNGQATNFTYQNNQGDFRLAQIANTRSDGSNISTFGYTYDAAGQIQTWSRQADAQTPTVYQYGYDAVGQVLSATLHSGDITGQVLSSFIYGYDDAGNRTSEQIGGNITTSTYNNLNQLMGQRSNAMTAQIAGPKPLPSAPKSSAAPKKPKAVKSASTRH